MVLNVCSLFCGLDFVCALSNMWSSNKNVVLTQRYPKHVVLKVPISQSTKGETSIFAQHIFIDLATCHYNLTLTPYRCCSTHSQTYPKFRHFSKFPLFGSCAHKSTFSPGPKYPFFNPQNSTYIRATDL